MTFAEAPAPPEELFKLMVDTVQDYAIYIVALDGTVLTWNSGAERNKGYRADEIVGKNYACFFPSDAVAAGKPQRELDLARRDGRFREEGWRIRKDGSLFWADITLTALRNDSGAVFGFAKITRDLSVQHQHSEELRIAKEQAEAASRAKSDFLANMSHELRTPLNAIIGFAQVLTEAQGGPGAGKNREYIECIHDSGLHLLALINDILDLAKLDAEALGLRRETIDLAALAVQSVAMMRAEADKYGVGLRLVAPPRLLACCDELRLRQVLLNLLSNAVKFSPPGSTVAIAVRGDGPFVEIAVQDDGIGIRPEDIERVMTRFGQVETGFSRTRPGTGLGLPLSKELVELHGGTLKIESRAGEGTEVCVRLPRDAPAQRGAEAAA
ncbi:MAG TPA: PAS domain-containing sensor histidine kinase [Rhizomicrobium sp.]